MMEIGVARDKVIDWTTGSGVVEMDDDIETVDGRQMKNTYAVVAIDCAYTHWDLYMPRISIFVINLRRCHGAEWSKGARDVVMTNWQLHCNSVNLTVTLISYRNQKIKTNYANEIKLVRSTEHWITDTYLH